MISIFRPRNPTCAWAGAFCLALAGAAFFDIRRLPAGRLAEMGPGFFPAALCVVLAAFGALLLILAFASADAPMERWRPRPLICIVLGVLAFAMLIERGGLIVAVVALSAFGAAASGESRARETILLVAALVAGSVLLFSLGLGLPFRLVPELSP